MIKYAYRDDHVAALKAKIEENEARNRENKESLGKSKSNITFPIVNVQTKIISLENSLVEQSNLNKGLATEIRIAKTNEKEFKGSFKREMKSVNNKLFEAEKRLPEIAKQYTKPIEEKLIMAYSLIDGIERQIDTDDDEEEESESEKSSDTDQEKEQEQERKEEDEHEEEHEDDKSVIEEQEPEKRDIEEFRTKVIQPEEVKEEKPKKNKSKSKS